MPGTLFFLFLAAVVHMDQQFKAAKALPLHILELTRLVASMHIGLIRPGQLSALRGTCANYSRRRS